MKKIVFIILILFIIAFAFIIYEAVSYTTIFVKFDDLEPFEKQMSVYFKGFKIGKTTNIFPSDDYTNTYLKLKLKSNKTNFPKNIWVNIKKKKTGGYVEIEYPDEPSLIKLKNNDEISGFITKDISSLLEDENLQDIIDDAGSLVENASVAVQNLNGIFVDVRSIITDNRSNIDTIIKNLADMSINLKNMSVKIDNTLSNENINSSMENINSATENIKQITEQVDNTTIPIVNRILCETYSTSKNANEITYGVKNTLKKRMGLARLFFGKPINNDCY